MELSGKVFAITGAGNGIAREVTLQLLALGARVAGIDVNKEGLAETATLASDQAAGLSTHVVNITDRKAVAALPAAVIKKHGQVDALLNVAGIIQPFVKINELDFEAIDRVMDVNLNGPINTVKAFLPELLKRPEAYILNVSSMGGYAPVPGQSIYGATKAGIKLMTEALHSELKNTKVHVTAIYPGAIATNIAQNSGMALPANADEAASQFKMTSAQVAGEVILDAMRHNKYKAFIGSDAKMMDFLVRLMPERAANIIYKQMGSLLG
jgi:short-subunit dehydrogenase